MAATTSEKRPCFKCEKGSGIFSCDGCQQSFCRKHAEEHRQELSAQMELIGQEYNTLQRDINNENIVHPLLSQIDKWERELIEKIHHVANQARNDLKQSTDERKQELKTTMNRLTSELQASRETEDYTEADLKRWTERLNQVRMDLEKTFHLYTLNDDDSESVIRLIKIKDNGTVIISDNKSPMNQKLILINTERFDQRDATVEVTENGFVATYKGPKLKRSAIVFGMNRYSTGQHHFRFRIIRKSNGNFYFGIVTQTQNDAETIFSTATTVCGWWRCDYAVVLGEVRRGSSTTEISEGDEMTLILDCEQRKISIDHHRTQQSAHLLIDTEKCPFPWKLVVAMSSVGNCVRIIN